MKKNLYYKAMTLLPILLLATSTFAQTTDGTSATPGTSKLDEIRATPSTSKLDETPATTETSNPAVSKVRIVRLSQVKGAVQIDRHIGRGFEPAIANLPVVEQSQLRTGDGVAEVEFEDNSSVRLAPNSLVEFPSLARNASGATLSTVHLVKGTAYVSLVKPQDKKAPVNQFTLMFGERKLNLDPATHVRLGLQGSEAQLAVLDGTVRVDGENGAAAIAKKKMATFQIFDQNEPVIAKDTVTSPFDAWDSNAASYHSKVAQMSAFNSPYAYGLNDMAYYGNFVDAGGCGSMWRPYFASAAWDPFANGTWAWYGGAGYSWVSPYPWAWTPYHYGAWNYCPGTGWGWLPGGGGGWYGVGNAPVVGSVITRGNNGGAGTLRPHAPPKPPSPGAPAMVAVNTRPIPRSEVASGSSFLFRKDSAGMGIPRETLGHLGKFSHEADSHGTARTTIYMSAPQAPNSRMSMAESMTTTIHRGNAPPPSSGGSYSPAMAPSGGISSGGGAHSSAGPAPSAPAPSAPSGGGGARRQ